MRVADEKHCSGCRASGRGRDNLRAGMDLLRTMFPRTRKLRVYIATSNTRRIWHVLSGLGRAGRLEELRIEGMGYARTEFLWNADPMVVVPSQVTPDPPPILNTLVSVSVLFPWQNTLLSSTLRHLAVTYTRYGDEDNLGTLLEALRNMPNLETLDIHPMPPANPGATYEVVNLPSLRQVRVPLASNTTPAFLMALDIAENASVYLTAVDSDPDDASLLDGVSPDLPQAIRTVLRKMKINVISHCKTKYQPCSPDSPPLCCMWTAESGHSSLQAVLETWDSIDRSPPKLAFDAPLNSPAMAIIIAGLDLTHVHTINLDDDEGNHVRPAVENLRSAVNVTTLRVSREAVLAISAALARWTRPPSTDAEAALLAADADSDFVFPNWAGLGELEETGTPLPDPNNNDATGPPFPRLRHLVLSMVDFPLSGDRKDYRFTDFRSWMWPKSRRGFDVMGLLRCLRVRTTQGASAMQRVTFDNCQCHESERLLPIVRAIPEVWWDGKQLSFDAVV
ncbi:hypothetical protein C8Q76DRAFT_721390 [Earliella scabrosa]|nr:hypothetical protein C8Q76DRAFT_721390 [Earliella scabrosa]